MKGKILLLNLREEWVDHLVVVEEIKASVHSKKLYTKIYQNWLSLFREYQNDIKKFVPNPFLIELVYYELSVLSRYFLNSDWDELYRIIDEIERIIAETYEARLEIAKFNNYMK